MAMSIFAIPHVMAALTFVLTATAAAGSPKADGVDHDAIDYVRPYTSALERAQRERRILIVRPFPVGGVSDGSRNGRWCPLADYMRATTLSDETVITLVNRRFVVTYFSLVDWADLSDAEAKKAILRLAPEYGAKVRQTPPTFFLAPTGELLATLDTLASPKEFLDLARTLLDRHPEYARPSLAEEVLGRDAASGDPQARLRLARLQLELANIDGARRTLRALVRSGKVVGSGVRAEALFLLSQRARLESDVPRVERYLRLIAALPSEARTHLDPEVRIERAYLHGLRGEWEQSLRAWTAIEAAETSPARTAEILYAKGLSYAHLGRRRKANYAWMRVLEEIPEGRFYQRARLAAMGPGYALVSPDLPVPERTRILRWRSLAAHPSHLPGSQLGYGTSTNGHVGTDEAPERFLARARHDYDRVHRLTRARQKANIDS